MSAMKYRMEEMIFDHETTYRTDYNDGAIKNLIFTTYQKKPSCYRKRPPHSKNVHMLSHWKGTPAPFSLFHKPKDIIGTNPMDTQKPYFVEHAGVDEEVRRTRPRLVVPPAVSVDDVEEPAARAVLCATMYSSEAQRASRGSAALYYSVKAPLPALYTPSSPITLEKVQPPLVHPEWRMESISWDQRQLRAHCETTKQFWMKRQTSRCRPCDETAAVLEQRKMQSLVPRR